MVASGGRKRELVRDGGGAGVRSGGAAVRSLCV